MRDQIAKVVRGSHLTEDEAGAAMAAIMEGSATPAQIGALLAALAARGESEDEVVGFARAMRSRAVPLPSRGSVDTCGTGGDGAGTFNISTAASLVVAACGVPVAKHGNRSASGSCGSADVLEALGLRLDPPAATVARSLAEVGWAFLFAPSFHAATRHAAGPRKELGVRTVFNLLGPLTNPALPEAQVVGVPRPELTGFMARCLQRLGVRRAWVVHGGGLDEVSPCAATTVASFDDHGFTCFVLDPAEAGVEPCGAEALRGGDAPANAAIVRAVLAGERGPRRNAVLLNAAAALVVAGRAGKMREGVAQAAEAVDSGRAANLLGQAAEVSRS
jgi:anthranilate phosphoribosyltransferase